MSARPEASPAGESSPSPHLPLPHRIPAQRGQPRGGACDDPTRAGPAPAWVSATAPRLRLRSEPRSCGCGAGFAGRGRSLSGLTVLSPVLGRRQQPPQEQVAQVVQVGRERVEGLLAVPHLGERDSCRRPAALRASPALLRHEGHAGPSASRDRNARSERCPCTADCER